MSKLHGTTLSAEGKDIIDIVFITDNNFAMPTGVAIYSLYINRSSGLSYNINVFCNNVEKLYRDKLLELSKPDFKIKVIDICESELHRKFIKKDFPVSISATFKFFLPELLPDLDKVMYIDGDVIIQSDLSEFYSNDISEVYAGVIKDYHALTFKGDVWKRLGVKFEAYFNSGVMLLNLKRLRESEITKRLVDYRLNGINYYMDQDALNVVFGGLVRFLPFGYNLTLTNWRNKSSLELSEYYGLKVENDKYDYLRNADIVHFASSDKPWVYYNIHYSDVWLHYFLLSPFCQIQLDRTTVNHSGDAADIRMQKHVTCLDNYRLSMYVDKPPIPLVSVIIPIYNAEDYLTDCLNSVFTQTLGFIEVICVDDGSSDRSRQILSNYEKYEDRIKVIYQERQYAGVARNRAISEAKGDYIVFIDSDDVFAQNALEALYNAAIATNADIVVSGAYNFEDTIDKAQKAENWLRADYIPLKNVFSFEDVQPFIFNFTTGGPGGKLFKRDFIIKNNLEFLPTKKSEDFYFIHLGLTKASRIVALTLPVYYRRIVNTSLENKKDEMPLVFWEAITLFRDKLIQDGLYNSTKQSFINENVNRFAYNLRTMKTAEGYKAVFDKLQDIYKIDLGLGEYPNKYYYKKEDYEYLCRLLSIDIPKNSHREASKKVIYVESSKEAELIRKSWSYRIGRFITFIPRKIRGGIRCYQEHGIIYTLQCIKNKLFNLPS